MKKYNVKNIIKVTVVCTMLTVCGTACQKEKTEAKETTVVTEATIVRETTATEEVTTAVVTEAVTEAYTETITALMTEADTEEVSTEAKEEKTTEAKPGTTQKKADNSKTTSVTTEPTKTDTTKTETTKTETKVDPPKTEETKKTDTTKTDTKKTDTQKTDTKKTEKPSTDTEKKECSHKWVWKTKTKIVHHDAVTDTYKQPIKGAWTEYIYVKKYHCAVCKKYYNSYEDYHNNDTCYGSYSEQDVLDHTIEHPAKYETITEVIEPAWDEEVEVNDYQYCSICGKKK